MPLPHDLPDYFDKPIRRYRDGTIDADQLRVEIDLAVGDNPERRAYRDTYLKWIYEDDSTEFD